uniref:Uncharacterized protein n=1 Tax=Arundo donax TaxID=35708 RepID=A0A0A9B9Y7_ARUDO
MEALGEEGLQATA